jgi:protein kinase A
VRLAKHKPSGKYYAIKILKKSEIIRLKQVEHIIAEYTILASVSHPFIVSMEGVCQNDRYLYLILEYINGGELFVYLRTVGKLDVEQAKFYAAHIVLIFEYLHSKHVIYRY